MLFVARRRSFLFCLSKFSLHRFDSPFAVRDWLEKVQRRERVRRDAHCALRRRLERFLAELASSARSGASSSHPALVESGRFMPFGLKVWGTRVVKGTGISATMMTWLSEFQMLHRLLPIGRRRGSSSVARHFVAGASETQLSILEHGSRAQFFAPSSFGVYSSRL